MELKFYEAATNEFAIYSCAVNYSECAFLKFKLISQLFVVELQRQNRRKEYLSKNN